MLCCFVYNFANFLIAQLRYTFIYAIIQSDVSGEILMSLPKLLQRALLTATYIG